MNKFSIDQPPKVTDIRNASNQAVEKQATAGKAGYSGSTSRAGDEIGLSSLASEVKTLSAQIEKLPDTRSELVHRFSELIATDSYQPSGFDIADALLREEL